MMCAIFAFISCEKPNAGGTLPIDDLELPDATTPIQSGADVTIKGKGFTAASEIWLNAATKADPTSIKAEVVSFTETSITFKVPSTLSGKCAVILKQDGKEYPLGELTFEASAATEGAKLFGIGFNGLGQTVIHSIDPTTGSVSESKHLTKTLIWTMLS